MKIYVLFATICSCICMCRMLYAQASNDQGSMAYCLAPKRQIRKYDDIKATAWKKLSSGFFGAMAAGRAQVRQH